MPLERVVGAGRPPRDEHTHTHTHHIHTHARAPRTNPTAPTKDPTEDPTEDPTKDPTKDPTEDPTKDPAEDPTGLDLERARVVLAQRRVERARLGLGRVLGDARALLHRAHDALGRVALGHEPRLVLAQPREPRLERGGRALGLARAALGGAT